MHEESSELLEKWRPVSASCTEEYSPSLPGGSSGFWPPKEEKRRPFSVVAKACDVRDPGHSSVRSNGESGPSVSNIEK
jgi:hypothetical protein